ncbi:MAG: hypothetical protein GZ091_10610 [Paludibacter sp.]|nr:hypothetical protein [Paludibacter sp.]
MKNLDLNNYGVLEMNAEEMRINEGGSLALIVGEGFLDGVSGNEHLWIFGFKIF